MLFGFALLADLAPVSKKAACGAKKSFAVIGVKR